jgi:hypothetical protein
MYTKSRNFLYGVVAIVTIALVIPMATAAFKAGSNIKAKQAAQFEMLRKI